MVLSVLNIGHTLCDCVCGLGLLGKWVGILCLIGEKQLIFIVAVEYP